MYGWLEAGGATRIGVTPSLSFKDTTPQDVVLRTSFSTNKLVFGNSNATTAGMYIVGNNVGIAKLPDDCAFDVHGTIRGDSVFTLVTNPESNLETSNLSYRIVATSSNIAFLSTDLSPSNEQVTMTINTLGVIKNKILIADTLKTPGDKLPYVLIKDVVNNVNTFGDLVGYSAIIEAQYKDSFFPGDVFQVGETFFTVESSFVDVDSSNLALNFKNYIDLQKVTPFPLMRGSNVNIQLLRNIDPIERVTYSNLIVHDTLFQDVIIKDFTYNEDSTEITLTLTVYDSTNEFIRAGSFYHIKTMKSDETMKLIPDNIMFCKYAEPIRAIGSYTSMSVVLASPEPNASIIDYIGPILLLFKNSDSVPAVFFPLEAPIFAGTKRPSYDSFSIQEGENVVDSRIVRYTIDTQDEMLIARYFNYQHPDTYIDKYIFILDVSFGHSRIWRIREFIASTLTSGSILLECQEQRFDALAMKEVYNLGRQVRFILFRYANYNIVGNLKNVTYIPTGTKLGVGTFDVPETLSVGGPASVQDSLFLRNDYSLETFKIGYNSNVMTLGDALQIDHETKEVISLQNTRFTRDVTIEASPFKTNFDGRFIRGECHDIQNISIDNLGRGKLRLAEVDDLKKTAWTFTDIHVHSCTFPCPEFKDANSVLIPMGVHLVVDTTVINQIMNGDIIKIIKADDTSELLYKVHRVDNSPNNDIKAASLWMSLYFEQETDLLNPLVPLYFEDEIISIHVLRTAAFWDKYITPRLPANVSSMIFTADGTEMTITATIDDADREAFIAVGRFYSIFTSGIEDRSVDGVINVVLLKGFTAATDTTYILRFKAIDNATDIRSIVPDLMGFIAPDILYVYPLDTFFQPSMYNTFTTYPYQQHTDSNVYLGFAAEHNNTTFVVMRGSSLLSSYISEAAKFTVSPIDRLIFDDATYEISGLYALEGHVLARAKYVSPNLMRPYSDTRVTFAFNGIPMNVLTATYPRDHRTIVYTIEGTLDDPVFKRMKASYVTKNVYIMDKTSELWFLAGLETHGSEPNRIVMTLVRNIPLSPTDRYDFSCPRHIFIVPLRYFTVDSLGDSCHIQGKLGIGTQFANERLTVSGDVSLKDSLVFYNDASSAPFRVTFSNDLFQLGEVMQISPSNLNLSVDADVNGFITARNFFTNSDRRLKTNINYIDPRDDLNAIQDINVCDFTYIGGIEETGARLQKGVIAQEIEKVMPAAVSEKIGFLPCILMIGKVDENGSCIVIEFHNKLKKEGIDICCGDVLKIIVNGSSMVMNAISDIDSEGRFRISGSLKPFSQVFVYGKQSTIKVVDHVHLFMTCVNAVKALASDVSDLQSQSAPTQTPKFVI